MNICFTCINESTCTIKKGNPNLIWDCSEFDTATNNKPLPPTSAKPRLHTRRKDSTGKGLCQNCAIIDTCSWYREDAVIFHCEHYQ